MFVNILDALNNSLGAHHGLSLIILGIFAALIALLVVIGFLIVRIRDHTAEPAFLPFYLPVIGTMMFILGIIDAVIGLVQGRVVLFIFALAGFYVWGATILEHWQSARENWYYYHDTGDSLLRKVGIFLREVRLSYEKWRDARFERRVYIEQKATERARIDALKEAEAASNVSPELQTLSEVHPTKETK